MKDYDPDAVKKHLIWAMVFVTVATVMAVSSVCSAYLSN